MLEAVSRLLIESIDLAYYTEGHLYKYVPYVFSLPNNLVFLWTGLSIHRIKRGDASDESYFREVQTLQMELQQIMKGT